MKILRKMIANTKAGRCPECGGDHAPIWWGALALLIIIVILSILLSI